MKLSPENLLCVRTHARRHTRCVYTPHRCKYLLLTTTKSLPVCVLRACSKIKYIHTNNKHFTYLLEKRSEKGTSLISLDKQNANFLLLLDMRTGKCRSQDIFWRKNLFCTPRLIIDVKYAIFILLPCKTNLYFTIHKTLHKKKHHSIFF